MPVSISLFFDRLRASELLPDEEFEALWSRIPENIHKMPAERIAPKLVDAKKLTPYQVEALIAGSSDPLLLGDYMILERIGSGGMGQVYKAMHRRMKRHVALKVLPTEAIKSADAVKRFQREVQAAARLLHTNIVTAFDAGESDGVHFLVMEFVDGPDLGQISKRNGQLPVEQAVDYILQAARGLAYAHSKGVVHRDIKPANLLVDADGTVKILDMGLARVEAATGIANRGAQEQLTQSGQVMGTLDFMAPEQAFDTRSADARSDIYSLGCTLYRLLMGDTLYGGDSLVQIILAHREQPIPSLCASRPEIPTSLDATFRQMVAKTPEERQASMTDVVVALEAVQKGGGPPASSSAIEPDDQLNEFLNNSALRQRPAPRGSGPVGSSVRVAAVAAQAAPAGSTAKLAQAAEVTTPGGSPAIGTPARPAPRQAATAAAVAPSIATQSEVATAPQPSKPKAKLPMVAIAAGVGGIVCILLVAVAVAMFNRGGTRKKTDTPVEPFVKNKNTTPAKPGKTTAPSKTPAKVTPETPSKPQALPAGQPVDKLLGLLSDPPKIASIGRWQVETAAPRMPVLTIAWAPDNQRVVVAGEGRELRVYDTQSWKLTNMLLGHTGTVRAVAWSPDGTKIASAGDDKSVRLWRADGTPGPILPGFTRPQALAFSPDGELLLVGDGDGKSPKLQLWNSSTGTPTGKSFSGHSAGITSVAWKADGKQFVTSSDDKSVRVWNLDESEGKGILWHKAQVKVVSWGAAERVAAVDSSGNLMLLTNEDAAPQTVGNLKVRSAAWSPDGTQLAAGTNSGIGLWDATGNSIPNQQPAPLGISSLAWSGDGKRIAWVGPSSGVWEPGGAFSLLEGGTTALSLDSNPEGNRFVSVHADGRLRWWRQDGTLDEASPAANAPLVTVRWSPSGQTVAAGGGSQVFLWSADRTPSPSFEPSKRNALRLAWSAAEQLVVGSDDTLPRVFSSSGTVLYELKGHDKAVVAISAAHTTGMIATASNDGNVRLWNSNSTPGPEFDLGTKKIQVWASAFNPAGTQLALAVTGGKSPGVHLLNVDGTEGPEIKSPSDVRSLAWSPDGQFLAGVDRGGTVRIWTSAGLPERAMTGHIGEAKSIFWSKKGQIVTAGDDRTVRGWDATTGQPLWVSVALTGGESVTVGADGKAQGSLLTAGKSIVYLVERTGGRIEVMGPVAFQAL